MIADELRCVYPKSGLAFLLDYAHTHHHSRLWIAAILTILARKGGRHG
jgi:hypothetical protein